MAPYVTKRKSVQINSFEGVPEDRVFLWWRSTAKDFDFSFIKNTKTYPELKSLSGMKWEYQGADAKEIYSRLFNVAEKDKNKTSRRGYWQTYSAEMNPEAVTITITFSNESESLPVTIRPKDQSEKNLAKVRQRMERYTKLLADRMIAETKDYALYQKDSVAYTDNPSGAQAAVQLSIMRSFETDNFGIWNVDRFVKEGGFVSFTLAFVDQDNNPVIPEDVFIADKRYNSVFKFPVSFASNKSTTHAANTRKVIFSPYSECIIWTVLRGGRLAIAKPSELRKLAGKKDHQKITVNVMEYTSASIENTREYLNF